MTAKKLSPQGAGPRSEPDLSQLATRKVDSVSSLAAEMMLRHAEDSAVSPQDGELVRPPPGLPMPSPSPPVSATYAAGTSVRRSAPPPAWAPAQPSAPTVAAGRVAVLVVAARLLLTLGAAAAFVLTR